jgi:hypothetical protein
MGSLVVLVTILFAIAIISGPIAIGISKIKTQTPLGLMFKRIFHGLFILMGTMVGGQWILIPGLPLFPRIVGFGSIALCYIGSRDEYFPQFRIISIIVKKVNSLLEHRGWKTIPVRTPIVENKPAFGPVAKWRNGGRSNGKDGHGPGGQH